MASEPPEPLEGRTFDHQVLVAGAGPTGLLLSLWLLRAGVDVLIVDKGEGLSLESRALGVQARTLETYGMLGLAEAAMALGRPALGVEVRVDGRLKGGFDFGDSGAWLSPYPYLLILSQNLNEELLLDAVTKAGGRVHWHTELMDFVDHGDGVECRLRRGEELEKKRIRYLCGCDGAGSRVRKGLFEDFPGGTYDGTFYVADTCMLGPQTERLQVSLGSEGLMLAFPMAYSNRTRLFGNLPAQSEELRPEQLDELAQTHFGEGLSDVHWLSSYRIHHRVAQSFQKGRVFLLGDAAHVHSPVGGQGMNTGLMDATNLGWKLASVLKRGASPELLSTYAQEREPFARWLIGRTDRAFKLLGTASPVLRRLRNVLIPLVFGLLRRSDFLRSAAFRTASQIWVNYRQSALSDWGDRVGGLRAGDRLPWVRYSDGADNFEALCACDWQIHVYGQSSEQARAWLKCPLHRFPFNENARAKGLVENAYYLVRPDGHIGLAMRVFRESTLNDYLERFGPNC